MTPIAVFSKGRAELLLRNKDHVLAQATNGYCPTYLIVPVAEFSEYKEVAQKFACKLYTIPEDVMNLYAAYDFFIAKIKEEVKSRYFIIADDDIVIYDKVKSKQGMRFYTNKIMMMDECAEAFETAMTESGALIAGMKHTNNSFIAPPYYERNKRVSKIYCIDLEHEWTWDWGQLTYGECNMLLSVLTSGGIAVNLTNFMHRQAIAAARRVGGKNSTVTQRDKYAAAKALKDTYPESVALKELEDRITLALYLKKDYGGGHGVQD